MKTTLILACAGKGCRAGFDKNKLLVQVKGLTTLERTLSAFYKSGLIDEYIVTASEQDFEQIKSLCPDTTKIVLGGSTRTQSVSNALKVATGDVVLIHDGARPFVTKKMIGDCIECAKEFGGCIPTIPTPDTIVKTSDGKVCDYVGKSTLGLVQTPQGFKTELIKKAYELAKDSSFNDDGEIYKTFIGPLHTYEGDAKNVKLTYPKDFESDAPGGEYRFGTGFDCHRLVEDRKLILGGVTIPHVKGLLGHSDADVLTHAIMDAILSASSNRDIGYHFSDKDAKYKDVCSMELLKKVLFMTAEKGYVVSSISAVIMAEKPKLLNHIPTITTSLSKAIGISQDMIGISATTLEGIGIVGREEGICVSATATLKKINC